MEVGITDNATFANTFNFTNTAITGDTTLYAKWTINNYTVTFNSQGGNTVNNENADYNSTIIAPTAPIKTGYTFGGWYKEAGCLNAWNFITDTVTSDTTLYCKMDSCCYTWNSNKFKSSIIFI